MVAYMGDISWRTALIFSGKAQRRLIPSCFVKWKWAASHGKIPTVLMEYVEPMHRSISLVQSKAGQNMEKITKKTMVLKTKFYWAFVVTARTLKPLVGHTSIFVHFV